MAMFESDEDDRRREGGGGRFPRERAGGERSFTSSYDRNGGGHAPPDPSDRRPPFKRSYGGSFPRKNNDDDPAPKRARNEPEGMEPMMSLQKYATEHNIAMDAADLLEKYSNYKDEYHKRQYKMFFEAHKNEEWFKQKYHPAEVKNRFNRQKEEIQRRLNIYNRLKEAGHLDGFSLEPTNARNIVRLLNAVIVLLGSGDDELVEKVLSMKISDSAIADVTLEGIEVPEDEGKVEYPNLIERYAAIIIRCIPSTMTAVELKEVCERCPGFTRLHLYPAQSETNWTRKAIAGFKQNVELKDVCLGINNIKVKGGELVAYVNSDSGERVRVSHPFINHKETALRFLHYALKVLAVFDKKFGFFAEVNDSAEIEERQNEIKKELALGADLVGESTNPLIEKLRSRIPGRIKEETSEYRVDRMPGSSEVVFERDDDLLAALDEIAFYLRVVYSFDLFDYSFYDDEDTLPNNLEIFHIRGRDPPNSEEEIKTMKRGALRIFEQEMHKQLEPFFTARCISDSKLTTFGLLDPEVAVEELITANTVKLSDEKWLCPLSGKKFKGPEFIRKHIQSKHADAIDDAKAESLYFNNYLYDFEKPVDLVTDPNEHKNNDPRERRRMAPPRREERSPRKEAFRENQAPFRRSFVGYKDLDAVADTEVANVF